eukprot:9728657-Heterocapsa_arctica.AAC.1
MGALAPSFSVRDLESAKRLAADSCGNNLNSEPATRRCRIKASSCSPKRSPNVREPPRASSKGS